MNGFEKLNRDELLAHLAIWNLELARNGAAVIVHTKAAVDLDDEALRDVVSGTASRLGHVAKLVGEQQ